MATVFLARDVKHDRRVALKVLRPELAALGPDRFLREIRIAAGLQHPNILVLHDSGDANGLLYYVMPFVDGESLRERLTRAGPLPLAEAVAIASEVADALAYAHGRGFVHRDIKPENILLSGGHAFIADFGIARAVSTVGGDRLTETGIAIGTPAYMSPEQFLATDPVDGRTDIYALGCVLYEMLAGVPPFTGPNAQAVLARHTVDPVPSLRVVRTDVPERVDHLVMHALAKAPAERLATAHEFRARLAQVATPAARPAPVPSARKLWIAVGAAALVILAAIASFTLGPQHGPASVAVLPFRNLGSDPDDAAFGDGMSEELSTALSNVAGLRVVGTASAVAVAARDPAPTAIGKALAVGAVVEGTVRRAGGRWRVAAHLVNTRTGYDLWSEQYESDAGDVFAVQDQITRAIVTALKARLTAPATSPGTVLARRRPANPEAHDLYLRGRYFYEQRNEPGLRKALDYFSEAIAKDSTYALAWSGLADTYSFLATFGFASTREMLPQATAAAERALALDSQLPETHTSRGFIALFFDWHWAEADTQFRRALALDSTYAPALLFEGWYHVAVGQPDSAVADLRRATALDPLSPILNTRLGSMLAWAGRYASADSVLDAVLALDSSYVLAHFQRAWVYLYQHRCADALAETRGRHLASNFQGAAGGYADAVCGHRDLASKAIDSMTAPARHGGLVPAHAVALIYAGLAESDSAFAWLDRAVDERTWSLFLLKADPILEPLRADPRFRAVVARVGLP